MQKITACELSLELIAKIPQNEEALLNMGLWVKLNDPMNETAELKLNT